MVKVNKIDKTSKKIDKREFEAIVENMEELTNDKYLTRIFAEFLIRRKLYAKDLLATPSIKLKKSGLYSKLIKLEELKFITSEYDDPKGKKDYSYATKIYKVNVKKMEYVLSAIMKYQEKFPKYARLYYLIFLNSFINREIEILKQKDDKDIDLYGDFNYGSIQFFDKEIFEYVQKEQIKNQANLKEKFKTEIEEMANAKDIMPFMVYSGFINVKEFISK